MPNCIKVPRVKDFGELAGFSRFSLSCIPWPDSFPYKPKVEMAIAHTDTAILIRFDVEEEGCRAVCTEANGPVWEDSCVEFFVKDPDSRYYYNFETSCIGVGLAGKRLSRSEFTHFSREEMAAVKRRASLPCTPFEAEGTTRWSVELEIPFASLDCPGRPERLLANFYKCGDKTMKPHFLSWSPVLTPAPDFHRPDFFGKLELIW